jgi:hypothetical protein
MAVPIDFDENLFWSGHLHVDVLDRSFGIVARPALYRRALLLGDRNSRHVDVRVELWLEKVSVT